MFIFKLEGVFVLFKETLREVNVIIPFLRNANIIIKLNIFIIVLNTKFYN